MALRAHPSRRERVRLRTEANGRRSECQSECQPLRASSDLCGPVWIDTFSSGAMPGRHERRDFRLTRKRSLVQTQYRPPAQAPSSETKVGLLLFGHPTDLSVSMSRSRRNVLESGCPSPITTLQYIRRPTLIAARIEHPQREHKMLKYRVLWARYLLAPHAQPPPPAQRIPRSASPSVRRLPRAQPCPAATAMRPHTVRAHAEQPATIGRSCPDHGIQRPGGVFRTSGGTGARGSVRTATTPEAGNRDLDLGSTPRRSGSCRWFWRSTWRCRRRGGCRRR